MSLITIHGRNRSGKSTTAKHLAKSLNYDHFSAGDYARKLSSEKSMNINELMKAAKHDVSIDLEIDKALKEAGEKEKTVIDCRMGYYFFPDSFKVYLMVDSKIAAERHFRELKGYGQYKNIEEVEVALEERFTTDKQRYLELYNTDFTKLDHYDLIIDTGLPENYPASVAQQIVTAYEKWKEENNIVV